MTQKLAAAALMFLTFSATVVAETTERPDPPAVRYVVATEGADGLWAFDVTVEHADDGWDHYADAWQVVDPRDGRVIAERILAHPHDNEQPFTRSLGNIEIPTGLETVLVRARCTVHEFGEPVEISFLEGSDDLYEVNLYE